MPHPARPIPNRMCLAGRATRARGKTVCRLTAPELGEKNRPAAVAGLSPCEDGGMKSSFGTRPGRAKPGPNSRGFSACRRALPPTTCGFFIPATKNPALREQRPGRGLFNFIERFNERCNCIA